MAVNGMQERRGRETRLLVLVVGVSIAVLLLLARFRFPAADLNVAAPAPSPLAGLASQAAFDEMAKTMNQLVGKVSSRAWVVELKSAPEASPAAGPGRNANGSAKARAGASGQERAPRLAVALLVRPGLALVHVPSGLSPATVLDSGAPIDVIAADPAREIAIVRVPAGSEMRMDTAVETFAGFSYVGLVSATRGGPTVQPAFLGRVNAAMDSRWPGALLTVEGASPGAPGTLVFSVDGRFVGIAALVENDPARPALVPASVIEAAVATLVPAGAAAP